MVHARPEINNIYTIGCQFYIPQSVVDVTNITVTRSPGRKVSRPALLTSKVHLRRNLKHTLSDIQGGIQWFGCVRPDMTRVTIPPL